MGHFSLHLRAALAALTFVAAPAWAEATFVPGETQYIAALGDPGSTSGNDAQDWGFWEIDPGP
ncbi:MAG: hypothetical protein ACK47S_06860, partial [Paracoccaceae bacterium]